MVGTQVPTNISELISFIERSFNISFYDCQRRALEEVLKRAIEGGYVEGIIQMPTGTGKTLLAAAIIKALIIESLIKNGYILFLAPRSVLREQAFSTFKKLLGEGVVTVVEHIEHLRDLTNGNENMRSRYNYAEYIMGISRTLYEYHYRLRKRETIQPSNVKVLVLTPQLLDFAVNKFPEVLTRLNTYMVICDEAHTHYVGERTSELISQLKRRTKMAFIGLTATPTSKAYKLFGKLLFHESSFVAAAKGIITPILHLKTYRTEVASINLIEGEVIKGSFDEWSIAIMERAQSYAELIYNEMKELKERLGRYPKAAVIASNTREADLLTKYLKKRLSEVIKAHYKVENSLKKLEKFKGMNQGVLVTVRMIDIGFDDPNLEVLFIARPIRKPGSYIQVRGRVLRKPRNKDNMKEKLGYALIVDFTGSVLRFEERLKEYEDKMFKEGIDLDEEFQNPHFEFKDPKEVPLAKGKVNVSKEGEYISIPVEINIVEEKAIVNKLRREYSLIVDDLRFKKLNAALKRLLKEKRRRLYHEVKLRDSDNVEHIISFTLKLGKGNVYLVLCDKTKEKCSSISLGKIKGAIVKVREGQLLKKFINVIRYNFGIKF